MKTDSNYFNTDLKAWISRTINLVQSGKNWNEAWQKTYRDLGGRSTESGKKGCPMNGTKTLYLLGRIKDSSMPYRNPPLQDVWNNISKNGVYSLLTLELLDKNPDWDIEKIWTEVRKQVRNRLGEEPAKSNQGGPTIAYKLWHNGLIVDDPSDK